MMFLSAAKLLMLFQATLPFPTIATSAHEAEVTLRGGFSNEMNFHRKLGSCPPPKYDCWWWAWWCNDISDAWTLYNTINTLTLTPANTKGLAYAVFAPALETAQPDVRSAFQIAVNAIDDDGNLACARSEIMEAFCTLRSLQESEDAIGAISFFASHGSTLSALGLKTTIGAAVEFIKNELERNYGSLSATEMMRALGSYTALRGLTFNFATSLDAKCGFSW